MKKKMMAFILSIIMAAGNMGIVPVFAEEEPVDETPQEIEEETEQTEEETEDAVIEEDDDEQDIPAVSGNEVTETVSEEKAGEDIADPQEPAGDETEGNEQPSAGNGNESDPGQVTEGGEGETNTPEETEPLVIDVTSTPKFTYAYNENEEWFSYKTFISAIAGGYNDGNVVLKEEFKDVFSGSRIGMLYAKVDGELKSFPSSSDIVDLSLTYYYGLMYRLRDGYDPTGKIVVKVNGKETEWTVAAGYLLFLVPVHEGTVLDLPMKHFNNFVITCGDDDEYTYQPDDRKIVSYESSDPTILVVNQKYDDEVNLRGRKPGTAILTVKGANGSVGKYTVTVKSFLDRNAVTLTPGQNFGFDIELGYADVESVTSSNTKAVKITDYDYESVSIQAGYPGKSTITVKLEDGSISTAVVTVDPALKKYTETPSVIYGSTKLTSFTTPGAKVTAKIGKKTYKATANVHGKYTMKIPVVKIGTKITLKFTSSGKSLTKTIKVKKSASTIETTHWVFKNSTKVRGKATKVHAGDYIKVTIDGKTYKKKITKNANSLSFSVPIKQPGKYGFRFTTELYNKFNQRLAIEREYVYLSNVVHVGDTKSKVKWLADWNRPNRKNYYTYSEQWCYDWYGGDSYDAYLYFRNGKVTGWQIFE